ncbi:hypothetical protein FB45DRAFT_757492 [Roridomyces roridus]|uniref:Integrase core domain-containing protein n=1 Tax=Roridomyces roridus TaxID=1738132 RepID=A0AAD7FCK5_9AGAR|nr:hypothetical protein FB45DRAFT_757492 [Roridomyces roridus]
MSTEDSIDSFLLNAGSMVRDAQFVVDSLPNVEPFAVERALRHLSAIHFVLANLDAGQLSPERQEQLICDTLESFRQIFGYLQENHLLDMDNSMHRLCLYLIFQPRIQRSLDETRHSWNLHKIRTAGNKTPVAMYQLSKTRAINRGYWTSDPGDDVPTASAPGYGEDPEEQLPPADELAEDPTTATPQGHGSTQEEFTAGIFVNEDEEIAAARGILEGFDLDEDDGNSGIDVYCRAVLVFASNIGLQI